MPRVYFLHILKTAGTSFRIWLSRYFHAERMLMADQLAELQAASDVTILEHDFYSGHFGWRMMERAREIGIDCDAVTVLRDPAETLASLVRYAPQIDNITLSKVGGPKHLLRVFCEQIATMSSDKDVARIIDILKNTAFDNMFIRFVAEHGQQSLHPGTIDENKLSLARERLAGMRFFGLVEDWNGTAILFAFAYGLPLRAMDVTLNKSRNQNSDLERERFQSAIEAAFPLEYAFHRHAQMLFRQRLLAASESLGIAVGAPLEAYRQPLLERFLSTEKGIPRLSDASIPIAVGIVQSGFDHRFRHGKGWIIWASERTSHLYLPLDPTQNLTLRFVAGVVLNQRIVSGLRILIAGQDRPVRLAYVESEEKPGQWHVHFSVDILAGSIPDCQYTEISFVSPELVPVQFGTFNAELCFGLVGDILIQSL